MQGFYNDKSKNDANDDKIKVLDMNDNLLEN